MAFRLAPFLIRKTGIVPAFSLALTGRLLLSFGFAIFLPLIPEPNPLYLGILAAAITKLFAACVLLHSCWPKGSSASSLQMGLVQPEVTVGRVASGPLASGKSLGVTGATLCGSKTSVRSSDLPLWQVTVASHTADCYPQPRFIEPSPLASGSRIATSASERLARSNRHSPPLATHIQCPPVHRQATPERLFKNRKPMPERKTLVQQSRREST